MSSRTVAERRLAVLEDHAEHLHELLQERSATLALMDRTAALKQLAEDVRSRLGIDLGFVGFSDEPGTITLRSLAGNLTPRLQDLRIPSGRGLGGLAMARGLPTWLADYAGSTSITHDFDEQVTAEGLRSVVAVPIVSADRLLGILYGGSRRAVHFGDSALQTMERLATRGAAQLDVVQQVEGQVDAAVQEERSRVAVQLHDSLGALLFRIGAEVTNLSADPTTSPELAARLADIQSQLRDAGSALRESLTALRVGAPVVALPAALRGDCRAFEDRTGKRARTVVLGELPELDDHRVLALSAGVREALLNVEKHSSAGSVMVTVVADADAVMVAVSDDGLPSEEALDDRMGMGLSSSRDRLEQVGGQLSSFSDDDGGWTVRMCVPRW